MSIKCKHGKNVAVKFIQDVTEGDTFECVKYYRVYVRLAAWMVHRWITFVI